MKPHYPFTVEVTGADGNTITKTKTITVGSGGTSTSSGISGGVSTNSEPPTYDPGPFFLANYDNDLDAKIGDSDLSDGIDAWVDGTISSVKLRTILNAWVTQDVVHYPDSDDDRLTNREEKLFGTPTAVADIDNDGYNDSVDTRPRTEDIPPTVNVSSDDFQTHITIHADDNSGLNSVSIHEVGTSNFNKQSLSGLSDKKTFDFESYSKYWVNVSDVNGNKFAILVEANSDGTADVLNVGGTLMGGAIGFPDPGLLETGTVLLIGGAFLVTAAISSNEASIMGTNPATSTVDSYDKAAFNVKNKLENYHLPIQLPSGTVTSKDDPSIGDEIHRGYGWEEIQKRAPGITREDIRWVIRHPSPEDVHKTNEGAVVIGEDPTGPGIIQLIIKAGVLISAESIWEYWDSEKVEKADEDVSIPTDVYDDKLTGKHDLTDGEIRELVENNDDVYKNDQGDYIFVAVINGRQIHLRGKYVPSRDAIMIGTGYEISNAELQKRINKYNMYRIN